MVTANAAPHALAHGSRGRAFESTQSRAPKRTFMRTIFGVALIALSIAMFFFVPQGLLLETAIAQWMIEHVLGLGTALDDTGRVLTIGVGSSTIFSIQLVVACSFFMLVIPLGLVAGLMLASGRASVIRAIPAFLLGAAGLLAVNAARLLLIASMTHSRHLEGFGWSHTIYGSMIALAGLALVLVGFVWFVTGPRQRAASGER